MYKKETIPDIILNKNFKKFQNSNPRRRRVLSMLLDHIIMCTIIVPLSIIIFVIINRYQENLNKLIGIILLSIPMFIYFNKDFFRAKSPAKRFIGYQVIDIKTNKPANELQCFIRNLTIIAWPLEVIIAFINPKRRIGDFIANTKVIPSENEKLKSIWSDLKNIRLKTNYFGILIISGLYFYALSLLFSVIY